MHWNKAGVFAFPVTPRGAGRSGVPQQLVVIMSCPGVSHQGYYTKSSPQTLQEINPANIFFQGYQLIWSSIKTQPIISSIQHLFLSGLQGASCPRGMLCIMKDLPGERYWMGSSAAAWGETNYIWHKKWEQQIPLHASINCQAWYISWGDWNSWW